jgi:hypothetical protein
VKVAIMQPSFLPWLGYFALIKSVDKFIFLDDVQFDKRSWQQRNYILSNSRPTLLTLPTLTKGKMSQKINETRLDKSSPFKRKHIKSLMHAYGKAPFNADGTNIINNTYNKDIPFLADFNIDLITSIISFLGIETELIRASTLNTSGGKNDKLVSLCNAVDTSQYITVGGSLDYIDEAAFTNRNIVLKVFKFKSEKNVIIEDKYSLSTLHYIYEYGLDFFTALDDAVHLDPPKVIE